MKVIGYIPLMYGAEYLHECIKSMDPWVEKIMVIYTPQGSQGHRTDIQCPESEELLKMIATTSSPKVEWHKGTFKTETEHRRWIYGHSAGYDLVLTLDADEVLEAEDMPAALEYAMNSSAHYIGINGFINFWRSFDFVCLDGFRPFRIYNLNNQNTEQDKECKLRIYHFSTCQSEEIVRFKWKVSGHASELRHNWIDDIYLAWTPENQIQNVHPVAYLPNPIWNAVPFDKNTLPELLKQHPNFNKALV